MAGKNIVVEGCTVVVNGGSYSGAPPQFITPASPTTKAGGKGIYAGEVKILVAGGTQSGLPHIDAVTLTFTGKAMVKADGKAVLLENDMSDTQQGTFQAGNSTKKLPLVAMIQVAGQVGATAS